MTQSKSSYGLVVTGAGTAINLALGALYTWSIFKSGLMDKFGLSAAQGALPYTVACLVFAFFMIPAGRALDRMGPRMVATVGGLLVGAGFILSSFATESNAMLMLTLGFGVLAGAGIGFGYAAATPAAIKWFPPEKKGLVVGVVVGGFGLASVYIAPLTKWMIAEYGVTDTFRYLGGIFMAAIVILAQFLKNPPEGYVAKKLEAVKPGAQTAAPGRDYSWREMMKTPQFFIIWLMFAFGAGAGLMLISFAKSMATGSFADVGFVLVALLAIGNASGRIIAGWLSDKIGRLHALLIVFTCQAIVLAALSVFSAPYIVVAGVVLVGFNYGACLSVFPSITADYFGMKSFGLNYGLVFTAWGFGSIMATVAGKIHDNTGSFSGAMVMSAVMCLVAAGMTFIMRPPAPKQTTRPGGVRGPAAGLSGK